VLVTDLTLPGLLAGVTGLVAALRATRTRRFAIALLLLAGAALAFHALAYTDVLSALILMVTLPLALGWALLADAVLRTPFPQPSPLAPLPQGEGNDTTATRTLPFALREKGPGDEGQRRGVLRRLLVFAAFALLIVALAPAHAPFIESLVTNRTGEQMIALAQSAPPNSTLMLPWGPRYFAIGFARDVLGTLPGQVQLVDHRADYTAALAGGRLLLTPPDTFYNQPLSWWEERLGGPVWLNTAAPGLVSLTTAPALAEPAPGDLPVPVSAAIACHADQVDLTVQWAGPAQPASDWSVFVHGLNADGAIVGQGDQSAPVFGWRPLSSWMPGEQVTDIYRLPRSPELTEVAYGFYRALPGGGFENAETYRLAVNCEAGL
jgi:hypothetical protein